MRVRVGVMRVRMRESESEVTWGISVSEYKLEGRCEWSKG